MKRVTQTALYAAMAVALVATSSLVSAQGGDRGGERRGGPPQEAFDACEGKNDGDTASFVSPRGDTVNGTCKTRENMTFLIPDDHPGGGQNGRGMREGGNNI